MARPSVQIRLRADVGAWLPGTEVLALTWPTAVSRSKVTEFVLDDYIRRGELREDAPRDPITPRGVR